MEIACFLGGITRTASPQSRSLNSSQSGSLAMAASISSSVRASSAVQSVLPRLGASRETIVIFSALRSVGAPGRDDPAERIAAREDNRDLAPFEIAEDLVPDFAMTI